MSRERGLAGEDIAKSYLEAKGYRITHQNFYSRYGEIDLVAISPEGVLVYVEVKSYKPNASMDPRYSITSKKQKNLIATAKFFILKHRIYNRDMRFDLIVVESGAVKHHLEHIISVA